MDTLPLELLSRIFKLASTDSGLTVRSLSGVCSAVRRVVGPRIFEKIVLSYQSDDDSRYLQQLSTALKSAEYPPRILHLWLHLGAQDIAGDDYQALQDVLAVASATIETLVYITQNFTTSVRLGESALHYLVRERRCPHLRDFTLRGDIELDRWTGCVDLPALRRLHFFGPLADDGLQELPTYFPRVNTLSLINIPWHDEVTLQIVEELRALAGSDDRSVGSAVSNKLDLRNITRLNLCWNQQPDVWPDDLTDPDLFGGGVEINDATEFTAAVRNLCAIISSNGAHPPRDFTVEGPRGYDPARMNAQWLERVRTGDPTW